MLTPFKLETNQSGYQETLFRAALWKKMQVCNLPVIICKHNHCTCSLLVSVAGWTHWAVFIGKGNHCSLLLNLLCVPV